MTIKDTHTGSGGGRAYSMTRSKISHDKNGYGKTVTVAREKLMQKLGYDPGPDTVAAHTQFGAHHGKDQSAKWESRKWNSAEMGMHGDNKISVADKLKLKQYETQKPKAKVRSITEKLNDRGRKH